MRKKSLGSWGENIALEYLKKKGCRFIARNFRSRFGEIDLIMQDKQTLVFVEVKIRENDAYGPPETAITPYKLRCLTKTAQYFTLLHPELPDSLRIDLVAILVESQDPPRVKLNHIQNLTL